MPQKFLSPGVFTTEVDQSFLAQGVAGIGAAVVGSTLKGPAFLPIRSIGFAEFADMFGATTPALQLPYAAQNYLRNSSVLTTVRVLGHDDGLATVNGYLLGGVSAIANHSNSAGTVGAVIHHSGTVDVVTVTPVAGDVNRFVITIGSAFAATASFLTSSADYVGKVLNTDPTKYDTYGHYLYQKFPFASITGSAFWAAVPVSGALTSFQRNFEGGSTPWVKSQPVGGIDFNLFKFHTLGHGRSTNNDVKVTITNIKPSPSPLATPFGSFDVVVRDFNDTDQRTVVLETFVGCTLDKDSDSYILRKIGDIVEEFDTSARKFIPVGTYRNKSRRIRVEMNTAANFPDEALPWGHRGYTKSVFADSEVGASPVVADMPLAISQFDRNGNLDSSISWGISFVSGGIADRMRALPNGASGPLVSVDGDFSLGFLSASYVNGKETWYYNNTLLSTQLHQPVYSSASLYTFSLPFAGGFDGFDLRVADPLYLTNVADETDIGVVSLKRALDAIANPDAFDMNLLAIPGVHNLKVTDYARTLVNDRQDAMYVMDITGSSVAEAIGNLKNREVDDNYTATYYPDVKIDDKNNKRIVRVSPSVPVLGAIAFSDRVGQVFFAPAGLNRGGLGQFDVVDVTDRLTHRDRDNLYNDRINPIASFPNEGISVFGQKTLQIKPSALDRINVRRLLIFSKKTIASAAKFLLFEPNSPATWQRFTNLVNPILEKIRQDQGLVRFKVVMDTTTNTDDLIDRNIMTGKIFLQPTKAAEFIDLSFVITNAGVSFGE